MDKVWLLELLDEELETFATEEKCFNAATLFLINHCNNSEDLIVYMKELEETHNDERKEGFWVNNFLYGHPVKFNA